MEETFKVELISAGTKKGQGRVVLSVDDYAFHKLHDMQVMEVPLEFFLVEAPEDKITCTIDWMKSNIGGRIPRKVVLEVPEEEKVKVGELCTISGKHFDVTFRTKEEDV